MSAQIRTCRPDEVVHALAPIMHFFGHRPTEEGTRRMLRTLEPERMHAACEGDAIVGGAGAFSFELSVPGGRVPAAGVTVVAVLPTHRRRGILRALMRTQLDDVHRRGEPVAYLWASEGGIYGRFGYGPASLCGDVEIARAHGGFAHPFERAGRTRLVDGDEALELVPPVYEAVARETPGMFARSRDWWDARVLADPEWRREGGGEQMRVVLELEGRPAAYALYRLHPSFEAGSSSGFVSVIEAMGATPAATAGIWRFLLDVDWMERVKATLLPVDHPLLLLVTEARRLRMRVGDALWVRLVDVRAALAARSLQGDGSVVLEIVDSFCPWNEGRLRVARGEVARTTDEPDLRLDVSALGSVYLGGFSWAQVARAGRAEELADGALERADALFRTGRTPWCPEIF